MVGDPVLHPDDLAIVVPSAEGSGQQTHVHSNGLPSLENQDSVLSGLPVAVQVSKSIGLLPFYFEYSPKKELIINGRTFCIGDYQICCGSFRSNDTAYVVVHIRHLPCRLPGHSRAYREIIHALGIDVHFPQCKTLEANLDRFDSLPSDYGLIHLGIEVTELFLCTLI